jgi:hypothetical protein
MIAAAQRALSKVARTLLVVGGSLALLAGCQARSAGKSAQPDPSTVLLVCNGSTDPCPRVPHYRSVQAAVDKARPGDWVLVWPGVYHERNASHPAGVWIATPDLHIRGLSRSGVIIDGSDGPASAPCPASRGLQDFTPRDGIVVSGVGGVTIENLTVCDYLSGPGAQHGSQVWWTSSAAGSDSDTGGYYSGDDDDTPADDGAFTASYLTTTSMYHPQDLKDQHLAEFGIYTGGEAGRTVISHSYASNMANGAFYVGACGRYCDAALSDDYGTNSAIGFLATNAGGRLTVDTSEFTSNRTGVTLVSRNTDDLPPPQDGRCAAAPAESCTLIADDTIEGNNNANAPAYGIRPAIGVGIEISGGSFDTIRDDTVSQNEAWGILINDNVDALSNMPDSHCQGGQPNAAGQNSCLFSARGNLITANLLNQNGGFGNPTNGDLAEFALSVAAPSPANCFSGNRHGNGKLTASPANLEMQSARGAKCGGTAAFANLALLHQLGCDDGGRCAITGTRYPKPASIDFAPMPRLPSMPDPCASLPANSFCEAWLRR